MTDADHTLEDEFRTPDRVRDQVADTILAEGLDQVQDLQARGNPSEILEDLLLDLHASSQDHRSFESWCHQDLPLALDSVRTDLKPTLWAWKQLVGLGPGGPSVLNALGILARSKRGSSVSRFQFRNIPSW